MNKNKKTLVILTPGFAINEADSNCLPLQQQLVRALKEINPELNIVVLSFQYPFHTQKYAWFNTTVTPFNGKDRGGLYRHLLRRKIITALKKIHSITPVSGLLSFWYGECAAVGKIFADKKGLKHFCWILGQDAKKENKYPKRSKLGSGELVAISDFIQTEFEKNHGIRPKFLVLPGINKTLYSLEKKEKDIDILGVGSLIPLKQYDVFIKVVVEIKKRLPAVKVVLAGDGPEKIKLEELIRNSGLQETILLTGKLPYTDTLQLMQRAKVFLHPSFYEGFVMVCLEALYAGARVISFVRPMNQEIKNWYHVNDIEEMLQKTMNLLSLPPIEYEIDDDFVIETTATKMMELFQ